MFTDRTFLFALLVWLASLATVPALPELDASSSSTTRPEPIEVEPETLTSEPGSTDLG